MNTQKASFGAQPRLARLLLLPVAAAAIAACGGDGNGSDDGTVAIETLSNRADMVSDGDALVRVTLPSGAKDATLSVSVDGRDVTAAFVKTGEAYVGVVTGLAAGANTIVADAEGADAAQLTVTNTSRGGPILSGPQVTPYVCATPVAQPANGNTPATLASGLSTGAVDAQCNIATEFKLYYKTTAVGCSLALPDPSPPAAPPGNPCFKPYTPGPAPADLATTTTDTGLTVPYIVRLERGTMNRGIYDLAVLFDPTRPWTATAPQPQWNGKTYFQFGASTGQPRRQARPQIAWTTDLALARGHMVVSNSMTDSNRNSNRISSAETVMMMKERIADAYGPIRFTVGTGCSGGSIVSHTAVSIAPGQLDGIIVSCTYPDSESTGIEVADCTLLVEAYQRPEWLALVAGLTPEQINARKAAINGHPDQTGCHGWFNAFGSNGKAGNYNQRVVLPASSTTGTITTLPTPTNNCELPAGAVYDPVTNPNGARCNTWSWQESIYGRVTGSVQANDPRDNVGIQYGLNALKAGTIAAEEFVTLNEVVGGTDRDSTPRAARSVADTPALTVSYRGGIVLDTRNHAKTAVIDLRGWDDSALLTPPGLGAPPANPIHYVWRSFSIRDRLQRDVGNVSGHALWRFGRFGFVPTAAVTLDAFNNMDAWLTTLKANATTATIEEKVRAARPASAFDFCYLSSDAAQSTKVTDAAVCNADTFLRPSASPRQAAGGARTEDALKCQLKPIAAADYAPATFTPAQLARLQAVFPGGVCDWSKPGVEQQPSAGPLTFAAGPGGQPLPAAPTSRKR